MNQNKKDKISEHLRTIAEKEGISEREVRNEIAYAVSLALKSSDPQIQNFWTFHTKLKKLKTSLLL